MKKELFMKEIFKIVPVKGRQHVVTESKARANSGYPEPNYMGTGMALCGVLKEGETLEEWFIRTGKVIPSE